MTRTATRAASTTEARTARRPRRIAQRRRSPAPPPGPAHPRRFRRMFGAAGRCTRRRRRIARRKGLLKGLVELAFGLLARPAPGILHSVLHARSLFDAPDRPPAGFALAREARPLC